MADRPAVSGSLDAEYVNGVITIPKEVQAEWDALAVKRVHVTIGGGDTTEHIEVDLIMQMQHIEREVAEAMLSAAGVLDAKSYGDRVRRLQTETGE